MVLVSNLKPDCPQEPTLRRVRRRKPPGWVRYHPPQCRRPGPDLDLPVPRRAPPAARPHQLRSAQALQRDRLKVFYTIFYDNSLDVATFTSQREEGKIDLRQQIGKQQLNHSTSITYRFDYRYVKASNLVSDFSPAEFSLFSLPARVGGPGFTFIRDKRDNPLESTKGQYFTWMVSLHPVTLVPKLISRASSAKIPRITPSGGPTTNSSLPAPPPSD